MTSELLALARSAIALPGWRWMPGMLTRDGRVLVATAYADGRWALEISGGVMVTDIMREGWRRHWHDYEHDRGMEEKIGPPLPDLDDAATGGCMLDLLGEERASVYPWSDGFRWRLVHSQPFSEAMPLGVACARVAVSRRRWATPNE